jgi:propane monooxygenase reductase subunit
MAARVTLMPFGRSFECRDGETILEAALRRGIELRWGCGHGGCGTCRTRITSGTVDDSAASIFALSDEDRESGYSLMCSAYPLSDVTLDLEDYDEAELFGPVRDHTRQREEP